MGSTIFRRSLSVLRKSFSFFAWKSRCFDSGALTLGSFTRVSTGESRELGRLICRGKSRNTRSPTLTCEEFMASVLSSHAAHRPAHTQLVEANNKSAVAPSAHPRSANIPKKDDSRCEIRHRPLTRWLGAKHFMLYSQERLQWADACKRVRDERSRNPSPGLVPSCDPLVTTPCCADGH